MKTAAEQLADALQRVIEEAAERAAGVRAANTPLRLAEVGEMLGYKASFVLRLCKAGKLGSVGEGKGRRIPLSEVQEYQRRNAHAPRGRSTSRRSMEDPAPASSGAPSH